MTTEATTSNPVEFAFCINDDWDRFVVRASAPERSTVPAQQALFDD